MRALAIIFFSSAILGQSTGSTSTSASGGAFRILNTDQAIFEAGENRQDLPCSVISIKPILGFDLRFHSGYEVSVPLRELSGSENMLTMLFRVTPLDPAKPAGLLHPPDEGPEHRRGCQGRCYFQGGLRLGRGSLQGRMADARPDGTRLFLLLGSRVRLCSAKDKQVALALGQGAIQPASANSSRTSRLSSAWRTSRR